MSYLRNKNMTVFSFEQEELFNLCAMKSSYFSRMIKDPERNYIGEEHILTEDERDVFEECVRESVSIVWAKLRKMCGKGADALSVEDNVIFKLYDGGCDERVLKVVDKDIQEVLVAGILKEWFMLCGNRDVGELYEQKREVKLNVLWRNMFPMRNRVS